MVRALLMLCGTYVGLILGMVIAKLAGMSIDYNQSLQHGLLGMILVNQYMRREVAA